MPSTRAASFSSAEVRTRGNTRSILCIRSEREKTMSNECSMLAMGPWSSSCPVCSTNACLRAAVVARESCIECAKSAGGMPARVAVISAGVRSEEMFHAPPPPPALACAIRTSAAYTSATRRFLRASALASIAHRRSSSARSCSAMRISHRRIALSRARSSSERRERRSSEET